MAYPLMLRVKVCFFAEASACPFHAVACLIKKKYGMLFLLGYAYRSRLCALRARLAKPSRGNSHCPRCYSCVCFFT